MISSSQRPPTDNTRHWQQTNIHAPGGIRTHDLSRRAAADLQLRPRGHWDRQRLDILEWNSVRCSEKCQQDACSVNQGQSSYGREAPVIFSINLSPTEGQKLLRRAGATGRLNKALQGFCFTQLEAMDHATPDQWHKTPPYKGMWAGIT